MAFSMVCEAEVGDGDVFVKGVCGELEVGAGLAISDGDVAVGVAGCGGGDEEVCDVCVASGDALDSSDAYVECSESVCGEADAGVVSDGSGDVYSGGVAE